MGGPGEQLWELGGRSDCPPHSVAHTTHCLSQTTPLAFPETAHTRAQWWSGTIPPCAKGQDLCFACELVDYLTHRPELVFSELLSVSVCF